jgi:hypothetical protein
MNVVASIMGYSMRWHANHITLYEE